jgi:hypothetical protein
MFSGKSTTLIKKTEGFQLNMTLTANLELNMFLMNIDFNEYWRIVR